MLQTGVSGDHFNGEHELWWVLPLEYVLCFFSTPR